MEATLEALMFKLQEKFKRYDSALHVVKDHLKIQQGVSKLDTPSVGVKVSQNAKTESAQKAKMQGTQLQELHHQLIMAQANSYRVNKLERRVLEVEGNLRERAPMVIDLD